MEQARQEPRPIDVVIPVYGAAADLDRCLASVLEHSDLTLHRLVLVIDGPQPDAVEEVLERHRVRSYSGVTVHRNQQRSGFVVSANRGMSGSRHDVVLLNSDTEVTARWLDKLQAAAYSDTRIGTVTPFSNNATICSLPSGTEPNLLPTGHDTASFGRLVEQCSERRYPRLPTGVGVCLYLKRDLLDDIGLLDETSFGLGYGEETDLCMRATAAGWLHVLDDATFIFHAGQRSFGSSRRKLVRRATRIMERRHRSYTRRIAAFLADELLRQAREPVLERLHAGWGTPVPGRGGDRRRRVLHLVHGWPPFNHAGTEAYARWLATAQVESGRWRVAVLARIADPQRCTGETSFLLDRGIETWLMVNRFDRRNPLARNALVDLGMERLLDRLLERLQPDLVHVHHLSGHCASLLRVAAGRGLPILYQVQDWWALCPRANLVRPDQQLCPGPSLSRCSRCLPLTCLPPAALLNRLLYLVRRRLLIRMLALADTYVMGSESIRRWYHAAGLLSSGAAVHVLPYGVPVPGDARQPRRPAALPLRLGYIGSIMPHKGVHVAVQALRGLSADQVELQLWGDPQIQPGYTAELETGAETGVVRFMGRFDDADRWQVLSGLDALLVPSVGLESFGLVAREAMAAGVPVLASDAGALAELQLDGCGATLPAGDALALRSAIDRLLADPALLERWAASLPRVKTTGEHAAEMEQVYTELLERRSR